MPTKIASENSERTLKQIEIRLNDIFKNHVDLSDVKRRSAEERKSCFLTRALAALPLLENLGLSASEACAAITDGEADDGIDAIHVDEQSSTIYLVQSKWHKKTERGIAQTDFTKFRDGYRSLLRNEWGADNSNLHRFKTSIGAVLESVNCKFVLIFVCTTTTSTSAALQTKIDSFLRDENQLDYDMVTYQEVNLARIAALARSLSRPESIDVDAMLSQWGMVKEPYRAVYENISAVDVVNWHARFENRIFAENLRNPLDKSNVNDQIIKTAQEFPSNFW